MSSVDKGDWWKHIRLSDIVAINDNLYLSTKSDSLFVSSDFGNKWQKYKLNIDSILNIGSVGDYLIIHTINNKLYKLNALGDELELLNTPIQFNNIEVKKDKFYIKNETSISKLKNDYTWETFEFFAEARSFVFIEEADEFVIFAPNVSSRLNFGLDIFKFDKNKNKLNFIHKYFNNNFNLLAPSNFEMYPTDAIFSNGEYVLSNYYKTILTSSNLINWKIVINGSRKLIGNTLFYNNDYIYSQKVKKSNLIKSIDGGVTFKQSWDLIVDTIDNKEYIPSIIDFKLKDANNGLILFDKIANNIDGNGVGISNRFMLFNNNEVKRLKHKIPDVFPSLNDVFIEDFIGNDYLVYSSYNVKKTIRNENNIYKDSIVRNVFYRLNENELDTLKSINDSIKKYNVLIKEDKVYLWGKTDIVDENNKSFSKFFYSSDSCKTINLLNIKPIEHLPNNQIVEPVTLLFDKNKNHYIITNKTIFVYDKEFNHIKNINTNSDLFNIRLNPTNFIEDAMFTGVKFKNGEIGDIEKQFYCYINDKNQIIEIKDFENDIGVFLTKDSKSYFKIQNAGYILISKPIEPDRLAYYTTVEKAEKRNYLYTFPPFPQPTKHIVKISTYWDSALPFTIDDVEIYNLAGVKINTKNKLSINKESNYNGHIIWDTSNEQAGIYIVSIKHGTETRTQKIIVE